MLTLYTCKPLGEGYIILFIYLIYILVVSLSGRFVKPTDKSISQPRIHPTFRMPPHNQIEGFRDIITSRQLAGESLINYILF